MELATGKAGQPHLHIEYQNTSAQYYWRLVRTCLNNQQQHFVVISSRGVAKFHAALLTGDIFVVKGVEFNCLTSKWGWPRLPRRLL